jgi:hypothetical protein
VSTDTFRDRGKGAWVKKEPFTQDEFRHDRNQCRAAAWGSLQQADDGSYASELDRTLLASPRARQVADRCLRRLGWRRAAER